MVVKGAHVLWNGTKLHIMDDRDANERGMFRNEYNLLSVEKIEPIVKGSKSQRKFQFCVGSQVNGRTFRWKAESEKERNRWVSGMRQRKEMLLAFHDFLEK